jgi:hypothetical protein
MRQDWLATWKANGVKREYRFTSSDSEAVARTAFQLQLLQQSAEVPSEYRLERVGEPYRLAERPK